MTGSGWPAHLLLNFRSPKATTKKSDNDDINDDEDDAEDEGDGGDD